MGYYADVNGFIEFSNPLNADRREELCKILEDAWYEVDMGANSMFVDFYSGDKYYYETDDMLNRIAREFSVTEGTVECHGENGEHWKFVYVPAIPHGRFKEFYGHVVYDDECRVSINDRLEFLGQLIDVFEDFLEEKGVTFHNDEREDSGDGAAIIYGTDYDKISNGIEETLIRWRVLAQERA